MKRINFKKVLSIVISIIFVLSSMVILASADECAHVEEMGVCKLCGACMHPSSSTVIHANNDGTHSVISLCGNCNVTLSTIVVDCSEEMGVCKLCGACMHPSSSTVISPNNNGIHTVTIFCGNCNTTLSTSAVDCCYDYDYCDYCHANGLHKYNVKDTSLKYRAYAALCDKPAEYYYSCRCGEVGSETFVFGTAVGHSWNSDGICLVCGYNKYSPDSPDETDTDSVTDNNETESGSSSDSKNEAESESDPQSEVEDLLDNFVGSVYGILIGVAFLCIAGVVVTIFLKR